MKFCVECGTKNSEESQFCSNCGVKLLDLEVNAAPKTELEQVTTAPKQVVQKEKKAMSVMQKVLISVVALLLVAVFGTKFYLDAKYDTAKLLTNMDTAFENEDKEAFYSYFEIPKGTVGTAEHLYVWIDDEDWSDIREKLEEQMNYVANHQETEPIKVGYKDALIVEEQKVLFGLSKKVVIKVNPLQVKVSSKFENAIEMTEGTKVMIEGQKAVTKKDEFVEIGDFIPGSYKVSYSYKGEYMTLEGSVKASLNPYDSYKAMYVLNMPYDSVRLDSKYDDAVIYINDKSTGKTIGETNTLYPVEIDEKVKVHLVMKDAEGKDIKSIVYPLTEDHIEIEFEFEADQELEKLDAIKKYYQGYREDFEGALNYADFSYITRYVDEDTNIGKELKQFVDQQSNIPGRPFLFESNDVKDVKKLEDDLYELSTVEVFTHTSYEENVTTEYERQKTYKIKWTDDTHQIVDIKKVNTKTKTTKL